MDEKPPVLDYGMPDPSGCLSLATGLGGVFCGFVAVICVASFSAGGTGSLLVGWIVLGLIGVAVVGFIVWMVRSRRKIAPFTQGLLCGMCLGLLLQGVCFIAPLRIGR